MRIGILTLPLHNNYGGILQAYALQKVLKDMGHAPVVLDNSRMLSLPLFTKWYRYAVRLAKNILLKSNLTVRYDRAHNYPITKEFIYFFLHCRIIVSCRFQAHYAGFSAAPSTRKNFLCNVSDCLFSRHTRCI